LKPVLPRMTGEDMFHLEAEYTQSRLPTAASQIR
jgi:hypothetical protein